MSCTPVAAFGAEATHVRIKPRNPWRTAAARAWSYPIPYAIGARIASDYGGRPVLPPSQAVFGLAQDKNRSAVGARGTLGAPFWNSRLPARHDRPQFLLATGNGPQRDVDTGQVESGGVAPRWLLSEPLRRAASVESLSRNHRSWMSTGSNGSPVPGHYLLVLLVQRIQPRLKELHEAGDAADVLRRAPPLAGNERRVVDSGSHSDARSSVAAPGRCRAQTFGLGADAATGVVDRPRPV